MDKCQTKSDGQKNDDGGSDVAQVSGEGDVSVNDEKSNISVSSNKNNSLKLHFFICSLTYLLVFIYAIGLTKNQLKME